MLFCTFACGGAKDGGKDNNAQANTGANTPQTGNNGENNSQSGSTNPAAAKLSGKLDLINLDDRDPSILRGVRITGLSVGTEADINGKESSLTDVRCVFELNEWIEFYPDTDKDYSLRVWVLKHRDDQAYYNDCKFSDLMPGFASFCDLHYPADAEDPENWYWGNFCLNPDECETGYYDFVFTYEGKAIAVLQTRFYNISELGAKSGAELEALMHE